MTDPLLIDQYLPTWTVRERHSIVARASREAAYAAIRETDLARSDLVRALLVIRSLPSMLFKKTGLHEAKTSREPVTLATFEERGFRVLDERVPEELVIGLEGRFWTPSGCLDTPGAEQFISMPPAPGSARAVWNFRVEQIGSGRVRISTETRVLCADRGVKIRFLPYWSVVRLGSGLIRRSMLRAIRDVAELRRK
ncbi:MAG: hypothetical protein ABIQ55_12245 [Gemmatimonadaceae bacterium]